MKEILLGIAILLLLAVFLIYAWRHGGIRCPNCDCRISGKYGQKRAFEGRFPCPKCGAMIQR